MAGSKKKSLPSAGNIVTDTGSYSAKQNESNTKPEEEDDDGRPAWSELKTKAGKERKRLPLACIACRRKKIRCSGEKPACRHCSKARVPCVYKVTLRKPAPRTDYMTMLDKRLKRMEDRVIKLSPEHGASKLAAIGRSSVKPYVAPLPRSSTSKKRVAEDELNDWANKHSSLRFTSNGLTGNPGQPTLQQEGSESLPAQDIQEHLSEVYFDYLYGQSYHILHKPSYMRKLKTGKVPPVLVLTICALSARFSTHPQLNSEPAFLRGEEWAKVARQIALRRYDEPSITILIVFLLLGLHEFGTCQGGRSWMFGGMALRMAYALQLHHELGHDSKGNNTSTNSELGHTDLEIRRRTMWACFLMDRFNSSGTDRPVFAFEESINIQLPIDEFKFQMEIPGQTEDIDGKLPPNVGDNPEELQSAKDNMGLAAYLIKIVSLWGKVVKYVNIGRGKTQNPLLWEKDSESNVLKQQLRDFLEGLPVELRYTPDTLKNHAAKNQANQLIFMHIIASQIALFLHKFSIPANPAIRLVTDAPKDFISQSRRTAVEAAGRISILLKDAADYHVSAPFVGYCAFAAGTIHIWCIFSGNSPLEAISKANLIHAIRYLTRMKRYWGMFHHMVENLKTIYKQHADWALKGRQAKLGLGKDDGTTFQYGDWFDTYPHGVSGAFYEDPSSLGGLDETANAPLYEKPQLSSPEDLFSEAAQVAVPAPRKAARKQSHTTKTSNRVEKAIVKKESLPASIPDENQLLRNLSLSPSNGSARNQSITETNAMNYEQPLYQNEPTASPYPFNTQPLAMAELDRQLVFGAYSQDFSTNSPQTLYALQGLPQAPLIPHPQQVQVSPQQNTSQSLHQPVPHPPTTNPLSWSYNPEYSMADGGLAASSFQDALGTSAWLMPFNILPPDTGPNMNPNHGASQYILGSSMDTEN